MSHISSQIVQEAGIETDHFSKAPRSMRKAGGGKWKRTQANVKITQGILKTSSTHPVYGDQPQFPYFIGNSYRSLPLDQNFNQSSDFAKTDLVRNTFPYRSSSINADNDYIIEPNEIDKQKVVIESVTSGSIDEVSIVSVGSSYKVGDILTFDDTDTSGGGLSVKVSSLTGEDIYSVTNSAVTYNGVVFTKEGGDSVRATIPGNLSLIHI